MVGYRRRKPLVSYEHGARVYAPSEGEPRYRVVATDADGQRVFAKFSSEDAARHRAREIESRLASSVLLPGRANAPSTVQNVGSAMRALVTFAYKNRWIPREADPMWLVRYSPTAEVQGQAIGFIPRSSLPTDEECNRLFKALDAADQPAWALAMRLKHRSGLRWGELIALRPIDLDFEPQRVARVHRAVEQSRQWLAIKGTKNRQNRVTTFPANVVEPLEAWSHRVERERGPEGLLFPGTDGGFAKRRTFQRIWARASRDAGWPMKRTTTAVWHPHDLRHVAACWLLFDVHLDPAVVASLVGHANAAFTLSRYVGVRGDLSTTVTAATDDW